MMDLDPRTLRERIAEYFGTPPPLLPLVDLQPKIDWAKLGAGKACAPAAARQPSGGGALTGDHYYRVRVEAPVAPDLGAYVAECADIIEALGMTFNEGECFKALWRLAAARQGKAKGTSAQYDADKVAHYGARVAAHSPKL